MAVVARFARDGEFAYRSRMGNQTKTAKSAAKTTKKTAAKKSTAKSAKKVAGAKKKTVAK